MNTYLIVYSLLPICEQSGCSDAGRPSPPCVKKLDGGCQALASDEGGRGLGVKEGCSVYAQCLYALLAMLVRPVRYYARFYMLCAATLCITLCLLRDATLCIDRHAENSNTKHAELSVGAHSMQN
jgi:hypothetical protein